MNTQGGQNTALTVRARTGAGDAVPIGPGRQKFTFLLYRDFT